MGSPLRHLPTIDRFWAQVRKTDDCWIWTGSRTKSGHGYGQFMDKGVRHQAHRFSHSLKRGQIPPGMEACHRCDNPVCVNPDHIFLGTHAENIVDMVRKGRHGAVRGKRFTHCRRGHDLNAHAHVRKNGTRYCTICAAVADRARKSRKG